MYRALVGVGMLCGLLIAVVYAGTRPVIERNRAEALERAVFAVLPGASRRSTFTLTADGAISPAPGADGANSQAPGADGAISQAPGADGKPIHAGYDADGKFAGVAVEASGMGYADTITVLYGYSPADQAIVGIRVLASKETPGLGDKIEKDADFLENFTALDVSLDNSGTSLRHRIVTVKHGTKTEPWQIDGITGATISSVAIGDILAASSERWIPAIAGRVAELQDGGDDGTE